MILVLLQGGELGYATTATFLRFVYYVSTLGGSGLAFFAALFANRLDASDVQRLQRWVTCATVLSIVAGFGVLTAHVGVLMGGETLVDPEAWSIVLTSPAGVSYGVGGAGMLLVASLAFGRHLALPAATGGILVCASYPLLGHTTLLTSRPLLAQFLLIHLVVAAYWIGSLPPLAWVARRDGPQAARLIEDWARIASIAVPVLAAAGLILAWWIVGNFEQLLGSWYGWLLIGKVTLVAGLLGIAARHRFQLTPALAARTPGAGAKLARSIALETIVALLVLYAVAEMVSTSPPGLAHGTH